MRLLVVSVCLTLALAGCAEPVSEADGTEDAPAALATGFLRGVVVDPAIRPIEGAVVSVRDDGVEHTVLTTDANGEFGVGGLTPGDHAVHVSKPGFITNALNATVEAGVQTPDLVQVVLDVEPEDTSFILPIIWEGMVGCAMGANWCGIIDLYSGVKVTNDASGKQFYDEFTQLQRTPDLVQIEVVWEPESLLGTHMSMEVWAGNWEQWETFGSELNYGYTSYVESPLIVTLDAEQLEEGLVGMETGLGLGMYAGCIPWPGCWAETGPPQAMVNQPFQAFLHAFYDCLPPEGWTFVEQGDAVCAS